MQGPDNARLFYLIVLGVVVGGAMLFGNRHRMGQMLQQAAIWFFIFVGGVLVFSQWDTIRDAAVPRQSVVTDATGIVVDVPRRADGHYYMRLELDGAPVDFVVDTGATDLVLSHDDAIKAGIDPDALKYFGRAVMANGSVKTAQVRLDTVTLGAIVDRDVPAVVTDGDLGMSLLGMSYLEQFGRIEIENDRLRLIR